MESRHQAEAEPGNPLGDTTQAGGDRLLLVVEPAPATTALIRRGRRVADYLRADCLAVVVTKSSDLSHLTNAERDSLQRHLNFARGLQTDTRILEGEDVPETIVQFARVNGVTQIFLAREADSRIGFRLRASLLERLVSLAHDMQVTIVADRSKRPNG